MGNAWLKRQAFGTIAEMDTNIQARLDTFFMRFKRQEYQKGEILLRADDNPAGVFYLKKGYVKQYAISKKGEEVVLNIFKPHSFFPLSWAINNTPNIFFYEAITDIEIWKAPKDRVIQLLQSDPEILYDLLGRIFTGIDGILRRMMYLMAGNAYVRLVTELLIHAKRFGEKQNGSVEIAISEKELAALTGMTRETVSREIKILKDKSLIGLDKNKIIIKGIESLEEQLGEGI